MTPSARTTPPLPMEQVFGPSPAGERELRGRVTRLDAPSLELLVRLDGSLELRQVRAAMPQLEDTAFAAAYGALHQRGLIAEVQDRFGRTLQLQMRMLGGDTVSTEASLRQPFSVSLVRKPQAMPARAEGQALLAVVVEDDPTLAKFIQTFLHLDGFEVRLAANRAEVLAVFNQLPLPDVVLMDGTLPDADGFQVLARLRQNQRLQHVPVIMLTARNTRQDVLQALSAGANGYVTKPFEPEDLMNAVRAVTGLGPEPEPREGPAGPWAEGSR